MPQLSDITQARLLTPAPQPLPLPAAAAHLAAELESAARRARPARGRALLRLEQELAAPAVDALVWLASAQRHAPLRLYWADRDDSQRLAGVGLAAQLDADDLDQFAALPRFDGIDVPLLFSSRFAPRSAPAVEWRAFGAVRAYLAEIELHELAAAGRRTLSCHVVLGGPDDATRIARLQAALAGIAEPEAAPSPSSVAAVPPPGPTEAMSAGWRDGVDRVLRAVDRAELRKVVLARRTRHDAPQPGSPVHLLAALAAAQPQTYRFCLQLTSRLGFFGASPELLYQRRGRQITSDALAGTRRRGRDPAEDARLADELGASAKERREHDLVREHIAARLRPLCTELVCAPNPVIERLPQVQHLRSRCAGTLAAGVDDGAVLNRLHPTPAVCGVPTGAARALIAACEGFDRGLYSGVVGVLRRDAADCAVAIRSALLADSNLFVFAGAGIVEGSAAQAEWDETASKLRTFDSLLAGIAEK